MTLETAMSARDKKSADKARGTIAFASQAPRGFDVMSRP
jgi:hypothetical protein